MRYVNIKKPSVLFLMTNLFLKNLFLKTTRYEVVDGYNNKEILCIRRRRRGWLVSSTNKQSSCFVYTNTRNYTNVLGVRIYKMCVCVLKKRRRIYNESKIGYTKVINTKIWFLWHGECVRYSYNIICCCCLPCSIGNTWQEYEDELNKGRRKDNRCSSSASIFFRLKISFQHTMRET